MTSRMKIAAQDDPERLHDYDIQSLLKRLSKQTDIKRKGYGRRVLQINSEICYNRQKYCGVVPMNDIKETGSLMEKVEKRWLEYRSIPYAIILMLVIGLLGVPEVINFIVPSSPEEGWPQDRFYGLLIAVALIVIYVVGCIIHNQLPHAPRHSLGILFVIDAENDQVFASVKYKLVNNFEEFIAANGKPISTICVQRKRISRYNTKDKESVKKLLQDTNCIFFINVRCNVDNPADIQQYEMTVDYSVVHPHFTDEAQYILAHDLQTLQIPVRRQRFKRTQTIDVFSATAQTLVITCRYIFGLIQLFSGNVNIAIVFFKEVKSDLSSYQKDHPYLNVSELERVVNEKLFISYMRKASEKMERFEREKKIHYLEEMRDTLSNANLIYPDTYAYNINMAYAYIILEKDAEKAQECIEKCKKSKNNGEWKYSEAFIMAYLGRAPRSICHKYASAMEIQYDNLVRIADYIEFVIEREPNRIALHLAAGLIYEKLSDPFQAKIHFSTYLHKIKNIDENSKKMIKAKMENLICNVHCNNNCQECSGISCI